MPIPVENVIFNTSNETPDVTTIIGTETIQVNSGPKVSIDQIRNYTATYTNETYIVQLEGAVNEADSKADTALANVGALTTRVDTLEEEITEKPSLGVDGYIPVEVINPLYFIRSGMYNSDMLGGYGANYADLNFTGNRTLEFIFTLPTEVGTNGLRAYSQNTLAETPTNGIFVSLTSTGNIQIQIAGTTTTISTSGNLGNTFHAIIAVDTANSVFDVYSNNVKVRDGLAFTNTYNTPSLIGIGNYLGNTALSFNGVFHRLRVFNYYMDATGVETLWNNGAPSDYFLETTEKGAPSVANTCVAEYLPSGINTSQWIDTSGNGYNVNAFTGPKIGYRKPKI